MDFAGGIDAVFVDRNLLVDLKVSLPLIHDAKRFGPGDGIGANVAVGLNLKV